MEIRSDWLQHLGKLTDSEISRRYNVRRDVVRKARRERGIPRATARWGKLRGRVLAWLERQYEPVTAQQAGKALRVCPDQVRKYLREEALCVSEPGESPRLWVAA